MLFPFFFGSKGKGVSALSFHLLMIDTAKIQKPHLKPEQHTTHKSLIKSSHISYCFLPYDATSSFQVKRIVYIKIRCKSYMDDMVGWSLTCKCLLLKPWLFDSFVARSKYTQLYVWMSRSLSSPKR